MHESIMLSYKPIMFSYASIILGPLHNMSVCTMARSHGVVGVASPVQLKPWTKPDLGQVSTTQGNLLPSYLKLVSHLVTLGNRGYKAQYINFWYSVWLLSVIKLLPFKKSWVFTLFLKVPCFHDFKYYLDLILEITF